MTTTVEMTKSTKKVEHKMVTNFQCNIFLFSAKIPVISKRKEYRQLEMYFYSMIKNTNMKKIQNERHLSFEIMPVGAKLKILLFFKLKTKFFVCRGYSFCVR